MKYKFGNILTGIGSGLLLGLILTVLPIPQSNILTYIYFLIPGLYLGYLGYSHPRITETWALVLPIFTLVAIFGNAIGGLALSEGQYNLLWASLGLIVLNLLSGDLKLRSIRRKGKKAITITYKTVGRI
jgi:hypothetical protein